MTGEAPFTSGELQAILSEKDGTEGLQGTGHRSVGPMGIKACYLPT